MGLRNKLIYQVYIRNHTPEGTINALIPDLPRIKELGTSIIHLLPIHPIGEIDRKGEEGSPYAISDYRAVNPKYGTLEDFQNLIAEAHKLDMEIMIDVVYNHTSPDSVLIKEHPEFFYRKANGDFGNKFGEWTDIRDFDFNSGRALYEYLIETLEYWTKMGVDGFRCDVASLIPVELWKEARERIAKINPDHVWLAESIDLEFSKEFRDKGYIVETDHSLFEVFDIQYQYDFWKEQRLYMRGEGTLKEWMTAVQYQDVIYPPSYNKLRFLENHDQVRFMSYGLDPAMWHAMIFFLKGTPLIFGGEEFLDPKWPDLFNFSTILRTEGDITELIKTLVKIKSDELFDIGAFYVEVDGDGLHLSYKRDAREIHGLFQLKPGTSTFSGIAGTYTNLITNESVTVADTNSLTEPIIYEK